MSCRDVQLQQSMPIPEFMSHFGTEMQSAKAIARAYWPQEVRCPKCSNPQHYLVVRCAHKLDQCRRCRDQTSLTAGTLMDHTEVPLTTGFLTIHLISQAKTGNSALALKRDLGVRYPTIRLLHGKSRGVMPGHDSGQLIQGAVEQDDSYSGGERAEARPAGARRTRRHFVVTISVNDYSQSVHLKLNMISGFTSHANAMWAKASLKPTTVVSSIGSPLSVCIHVLTLVNTLEPCHLLTFKWVDTVLGELKTMMTGALKALNIRKHA